jgi:putative endonuclease
MVYMVNDKQSLGKLGEEIAINFLKKNGYKILDRNFKASRFGEIDIVAIITRTNADWTQTNADKKQAQIPLRGMDKKQAMIWEQIFNFIRNSLKFVIRRKPPEATIVFVEVKTKSGDEFGSPEEEFTIFKKEKMRRAIQDWFWTKKVETNNWRIDLIAVDFSQNEKEPEIRHYPGCA